VRDLTKTGVVNTRGRLRTLPAPWNDMEDDTAAAARETCLINAEGFLCWCGQQWTAPRCFAPLPSRAHRLQRQNSGTKSSDAEPPPA
jgi:hypothetical protein